MVDVVRAVLDSFYMAAAAYVKPGAPHRLTAGPGVDRLIVWVISMLPQIEEAAERGRATARGERSMPASGIGQLVLDAVRTAYSWTGAPPRTGLAVAAVHSAYAAGYTEARYGAVEPGNYRQSLYMSVSNSGPEDLSNLMDALRVSGEERLLDVLEARGVRKSRAVMENMNLLDAYRVLDNIHPYKGFAEPRLLGEVSSRIQEAYRESKDANASIAEAYAALLSPRLSPGHRRILEEAGIHGFMRTSRGAKLLLKLDRDLRREGRDFEDIVYLLAASLVPLSISGLKP